MKRSVLKKVLSCLSAAAIISSFAVSVNADADTLRINNGANLAGYVMKGAKVKMSVSGVPSGTAKVKWYTGLNGRDKTQVAESYESDGTCWVDVPSEKRYIFAEALDAEGNILAEGDTSMAYGTDFDVQESILSENFDDGYAWHGYQWIVSDADRSYKTLTTGGRIGVTYGNPEDAADPAGKNGNCMKLTDSYFNYIELVRGNVNYPYTLDTNSIYVLESDMWFDDLSDRSLTKVTYQDSSQAAAGHTDGRDSVAITLSNGSFEFYGNTIPAETGKWYNIKYVYDAINGQLTALINNQYLGLAAGVDMVTWGRLTYVNCKTSNMYLDNLKITKYAPAVSLAEANRQLTASAAEGDVSIWRSLDGVTYKKAANGTSYTAEELPYKQYFAARTYNGGSYSQSKVVEIPAFSQVTTKKVYYDYNFDNSASIEDYGFAVEGNAEKISVKDGKMVISEPASDTLAVYYLTKSANELNGLDNGIIYTEADMQLSNNWRARYMFRLQYSYDSSLSNLGSVRAMVNGTSNIQIVYTDAEKAEKTIDTGISWGDQVHYKVAVDVDNNTVTITMNDKSFTINDLGNIGFLKDIGYGSYADGIVTVDNVSCYKYEKSDITQKFGFAEKSYLYSSSDDNNVENGMIIAAVVTNDDKAKDYVSYAAVYDENGNLAEVARSKVTMSSGDYAQKNYRFENEYPENRIKIFSWDSSMVPVLTVE